MESAENPLAQAERYLLQASRMLAHANNLQPEEWLLLATLVGGADLMVRQGRQDDPGLQMPLLDEVVRDFQDLSAGFTDPVFLSASRAARQRNPELFRLA